ncbi:MAG: methylated-DNA--[protein]-cysteine S-methyltransferase [Chitinophagaceae bacterium]|nr:methylated-DNA--[protein]-cysteine S-methyltransferase [Chitinophagaceae bacterium]
MPSLLLSDDIMHEALLNKDSQFEGLFFAAVKTTGIFCRPTCTARKPKKENVEFFETSREALIHGYRPCKLCRPLEKIGVIPDGIQGVMNELQANPDIRLTDYTLFKRGIDPNSIRRWFQKNHGITFQAYQRLTRINNAMTHIRNGDKVIEAAFENGYESLSGFQYSFKKATNHSPLQSKKLFPLTVTRIVTPLGPILIVATDEGICLLEFTDRRMLETELKQLQAIYKTPVLPGKSKYFGLAEQQLTEYFEGNRQVFDLPLVTPGTPFQLAVWKALQSIPYGTTRSYKQQAVAVGNPQAVRAVARANGFNRICIVIPCHRVVGDDGHLTGYGGGLWRKKWLLDHEVKNKS